MRDHEYRAVRDDPTGARRVLTARRKVLAERLDRAEIFLRDVGASGPHSAPVDNLWRALMTRGIWAAETLRQLDLFLEKSEYGLAAKASHYLATLLDSMEFRQGLIRQVLPATGSGDTQEKISC